MPNIVTSFRPGRVVAPILGYVLGGAVAAIVAATPGAAPAQDDGGPTTANTQLQKILAVLQTNPNAASQDCLGALQDLHKTQDTLVAEESRNKDQDVEVARDVLESDFETAGQSCAPDAAAICDKADSAAPPKLVQACRILHGGRAGRN